MAHDGRVCVTGATGFIGSAVVRKLLGQKRDVRCIVEPGANTHNLEGLPVERVTCDVNDIGGMRRALEDAGTLFHLAAIYKTWAPRAELLYRVNVEGTVTTLLAAQKARVKRVVHTSSIAAVGLVEKGLADEDTAFDLFDIATPYILSKWQSERVAKRFAESGLDVVIVNPAFPFGPGDVAPTPTGAIVLSLLERKVPGYGPGGICTIDVDDCAEGHLLAEAHGRAGERYILGSDNVTLKELFERVTRIAKVPMPWLRLPGSMVAGVALGMELWADRVSGKEPTATYRSMLYTQRSAFFSNAKAKRELGIRTRPLDETIERAVDWFRGDFRAANRARA
ncbi:Dihydroflavonol-4-reductase [Labilithrix luteola]|uniref:Dihydroflavonol-4-reductase n=1 Tax=Labilithrix luteola TaxID=1391654 RepID=A0A0K1PV29_9BACT|nr:NAD-dependent epimerase/dehydratase family protein [Labilithrix luteola]AKU97211.1 Dihydroflavonol-4-reductase [Labilithrix luteola]